MIGRRALTTMLARSLVAVSIVGPPTVVADDSADTVLVGAGDVASCASTADTATAALLDSIAGTVITLGDNAYPNGTRAEFRDCYDPTWGRHRARTRPAPGNHDYRTDKAAGYFGYFGAAAGPRSKGYYSYDAGAWHVIVLNSECAAVGGCGTGSPQGPLAARRPGSSPRRSRPGLLARTRLQLGRPRREPGRAGVLGDPLRRRRGSRPERPRSRLRALRAAGPLGSPRSGARHAGIRRRDRRRGLRERASSATNSEVFAATHGVLKLTLRADGYDWAFVPVAGQHVQRRRLGATHDAPATRTRRTFAVSSDAWVDQAHRNANHGTSTRLLVDGDTGAGLDARSFVKVRVAGLTGVIDRAALRVWVTDPTQTGPTVARTSTSWSGRRITWANQPAATGPPVDAGPIVSGRLGRSRCHVASRWRRHVRVRDATDVRRRPPDLVEAGVASAAARRGDARRAVRPSHRRRWPRISGIVAEPIPPSFWHGPAPVLRITPDIGRSHGPRARSHHHDRHRSRRRVRRRPVGAGASGSPRSSGTSSPASSSGRSRRG